MTTLCATIALLGIMVGSAAEHAAEPPELAAQGAAASVEINQPQIRAEAIAGDCDEIPPGYCYVGIMTLNGVPHHVWRECSGPDVIVCPV
ncbi:hypothetical protein ABI59_06550 [Acidobacteria bacterium Mor1]|nr:hypothetical protein ABI59_06550 [Acidobacteria bacterium Mor1]